MNAGARMEDGFHPPSSILGERVTIDNPHELNQFQVGSSKFQVGKTWDFEPET
jgi:hypothetical protein